MRSRHTPYELKKWVTTFSWNFHFSLIDFPWKIVIDHQQKCQEYMCRNACTRVANTHLFGTPSSLKFLLIVSKRSRSDKCKRQRKIPVKITCNVACLILNSFYLTHFFTNTKFIFWNLFSLTFNLLWSILVTNSWPVKKEF